MFTLCVVQQIKLIYLDFLSYLTKFNSVSMLGNMGFNKHCLCAFNSHLTICNNIVLFVKDNLFNEPYRWNGAHFRSSMDILQENSSTFVIYPDNVTQDLKFHNVILKKKSLIN